MNNLGDYYAAFIDSTFFMVFIWYYAIVFILTAVGCIDDFIRNSPKELYLSDFVVGVIFSAIFPLMAPVALIVVIISQIRFPEIVLWRRK